ncbi:MAG: site-specific DNA-methyltransferase [Proteobacteria bacterium]|nr:site-specific DNA-methyltransferase [Pseudomonadota bacterium]
MTAEDLLHSLKSSGIELRAEGESLKWRAPKGIMKSELRKSIKKHKAELLFLLQTNEADDYRQNVINQIIQGDCLEVLKGMPDSSIDLIVTDPPYGYKFMGKSWDKAIPGVEIWEECLRVLKPGAFAFVMSAPRQDCLSRMILNLETAGFKIYFTSLFWTYAEGFPKAHNISKAIDKKLGAEREIIARNPNSRENCDKSNTIYESGTVGNTAYLTEPATEDAKRLDGSYAGFQPKPAVEVIIVAMKPLDEKTYTNQAISNSKGITWLDDSRIPYVSDDEHTLKYDGYSNGSYKSDNSKAIFYGNQVNINLKGRFPANLLVSDDVLNDGVEHKSPKQYEKAHAGFRSSYVGGKEKNPKLQSKEYGDTGGYSRFFSLDAWADFNIKDLPEQVQRNLPFLIVPKASKKEKNAGIDKSKEEKKGHPTVKPIKLMSYLITMGSREGDIVFDPYAGSGSTCVAAKMLNRQYIGIELDPEYYDIALKRIESVEPIEDERKIDKDISGPIIQNLKFIVARQIKKNPIGVKIALKFYVNKVSEIKRRHSVVDIFEDNENALRNDLSDFFRKEARRFVEPNKNGGKGSKAKIEIRIKNTPKVAGLCLVIKNTVHGSSFKAGNVDNLATGDRNEHEFEIEDLMPYLPILRTESNSRVVQ